MNLSEPSWLGFLRLSNNKRSKCQNDLRNERGGKSDESSPPGAASERRGRGPRRRALCVAGRSALRSLRRCLLCDKGPRCRRASLCLIYARSSHVAARVAAAVPRVRRLCGARGRGADALRGPAGAGPAGPGPPANPPAPRCARAHPQPSPARSDLNARTPPSLSLFLPLYLWPGTNLRAQPHVSPVNLHFSVFSK